MFRDERDAAAAMQFGAPVVCNPPSRQATGLQIAVFSVFECSVSVLLQVLVLHPAKYPQISQHQHMQHFNVVFSQVSVDVDLRSVVGKVFICSSVMST